MNIISYLPKIEKYLVIFSLTAFFFFWGLKLEYFQARLLVFLPLLIIIYQTYKNRNYNFVKLPAIILGCLLIHLMAVKYFFGIFNFITIIYSIFLTFIAIILSYYKELILKNLYLIVNTFIFITPIIIFINLYLSLVLSAENSSLPTIDLFINCDRSAISFGKFIFQENSHFSMMAVPVILSFFFLKKKLLTNLNKIFFAVFLIINIIFFSTTLLVSLILCSLYFIFYLLINNSIGFNLTKYDKLNNNLLSLNITFQKNFKKIIILFIVVIVSYGISVLPTCKKKIYETVYLITKVENEISIANKNDQQTADKRYEVNSSSSTFYYSLLVTLESLKKFSLIGVGINNYETAFNSAAEGLRWFIDKEGDRKIHDYAASVNKQDGYNNFSKILVEFGILSLLLIPVFLKFMFSNKVNLFHKVFFSSLVITQLLKGAGYFNGGFIVAILFILIIIFDNDKINYS